MRRPRTAVIGHRPSARLRSVVIVMASFLGFVAFFWPFVVAPGHVRRHRHGAADVRGSARPGAGRRLRRRSPTAASTPRPSPCWACSRPSGPPCVPWGPARPASRLVFFTLVHRRPGVRTRIRLRPRLHHPVRLGPHHRGRRAVDALPDVRMRLGRAVRRPAPTGHRSAGGPACSPSTAPSPATSSASC